MVYMFSYPELSDEYFAAVKDEIVLVSNSFAAFGEFGSSIKLDFVCAPIACSVS